MADRSDELYLSNAIIMRIVKDAFPSDTSVNVSREARSALSKAASSFVLCVSTMASAHCEAGKRKTLAAQDIIGGLRDMQFGHYEPQVQQFLEQYRSQMAAKKSAIKKVSISIDRDSEEVNDQTQEDEGQ